MRDTQPHIKLCYVQRNFTGYTQSLDRACMRAFKSSIRQEVAKHFFLEAESNFEHVNLDSSTSVLRQLPQHRDAGWRFIDWNEVWSSLSFSQKQNVLWRQENRFHEAQPRNLTRT